MQSDGVFAVFLSAWGEKFKETLSSFLASFPDGAAFSRRLPCPTSLEEIGVFPAPSLPQKGSGMGGGGENPKHRAGQRSANTLAWGSLCQRSPVELDTRRVGEEEGGKVSSWGYKNISTSHKSTCITSSERR